MPRIFDCFTFFNENDVLDIRFQELADVVNKFVIIQSDVTFRGNPKPDYFDYDRFRKYKSKIILVTLPGLPGKTTWEREIFQRNFIAEVLAVNVDRDDTIIISDVDEIPRRSVVGHVDEHTRLSLAKYSYAINMLTNEENTAARILPYRAINASIQEIRKSLNIEKVIENAGWEFSSLSTDAAGVLKKLRAFAHDELDHVINEDILRARMEAGLDILGRDITMTPVEIDSTFPEAIKNNPEYWSKYLWT